MQQEIVRHADTFDPFPGSVRGNIGLVRLSGADRNDRDLRLIQGSALERLLSDKTLRSRLGNEIAKTDVKGVLHDDAKTALGNLDERFGKRALPTDLSLGLVGGPGFSRSEEHTSELQSLMRNSYAVFCLKKKKEHHYKHD